MTLPVNAANLEVTELTTVEDILVAAPKYAFLSGREIPLAELAHYPLLLLEKNSTTRRNLDQFLRQRDISISPEMELESVHLLVEFARIGLGIAHVLKESVREEMAKGDLIVIQTREKLPRRKLGLVTNRNVPLSQAGKKLAELFTQDAQG